MEKWEHVKTGFNENEYTAEILDDILNASTPSACINGIYSKGYMQLARFTIIFYMCSFPISFIGEESNGRLEQNGFLSIYLMSTHLQIVCLGNGLLVV